jgi:serine/threonine-protein kinase RsbW
MYRKLQIESRIICLKQVEKVIDEIKNELGVSLDSYGKILVSTLEGANNAITHGNKSDPGKFVKIEIHYFNDVLKIKITDEGDGFNPENLPDPTDRDKIELLNGRGVYIMSQLADEIGYNEKGNEVTMIFKNIIG